ncbi:MAG: PilZ domain-containing protein [Anaerolineales bacterium]|nr:PilZ domain-containing protein [Anaerolineales bacterium]
MKERRKATRHTLIYYMRVFNVETRNLVGYLVDIAPNGIMLLCDDPVTVDRSISARLELSEDITDKPYLHFTAKCVWCKPDLDPHFFNAGFEIQEIDPEDSQLIERIVKNYGIQERRLKLAKQDPDTPPQEDQ